MKRHEQVFVKVNAELHEAIEPVVEALSLFPKLHTIDTCQGFIDKKNPHQISALVHPEYGSSESLAFQS